jgi:hypothetical protein
MPRKACCLVMTTSFFISAFTNPSTSQDSVRDPAVNACIHGRGLAESFGTNAFSVTSAEIVSRTIYLKTTDPNHSVLSCTFRYKDGKFSLFVDYPSEYYACIDLNERAQSLITSGRQGEAARFHAQLKACLPVLEDQYEKEQDLFVNVAPLVLEAQYPIDPATTRLRVPD